MKQTQKSICMTQRGRHFARVLAVNINPFWQEVLFGGLFLAVIVVYPAGFVGLVEAVVRRLSGCCPGARATRCLPRRPCVPPSMRLRSASPRAAAAREGAQHPEVVPGSVSSATRTATAGSRVECRGSSFAYSGAAWP